MQKIKRKDVQNFIYIWICVFVIIGVYPLINGEDLRKWSLYSSFLIFIVSLLNFKIVEKFYIYWVKLGEFMGAIVSKIVLFILFFSVFTPISLILKILGKDLLDKKLDSSTESYWISRPIQPQSMKNQF